MTPYLGTMPLATLRSLAPIAIPGFGDLTRDEQTVALQNILAEADFDSRREAIVDQLISECALRDVVPEVYGRFRPLVLDAVRFTLMHLGKGRLVRLLVRQFQLPGDAPAGRRLAELARELPVLHKLGQMIARNEHVDEGFRTWLLGLESWAGGSSVTTLAETAAADIARGPIGVEIAWNGTVLAEASVGAVLPFEWLGLSGGPGRRGVAKLVKPSATSRLDEDLPALDRLAFWLAARKGVYGDLGIDYIGVLRDVREALAAETDPRMEQRNLRTAAAQYRESPDIRIPTLFPFSTPSVTAMERLDGMPLPEVSADATEKRRLARLAFRELIIGPMLSEREFAIVHGDPHAGNLLAVPAEDRSGWSVGLIDWSQAGLLDRKQRKGLRDLMLGFMICDARVVNGAVRLLLSSSAPGGRLERHLGSSLGKRPLKAGDAFEASLTLIDRLVIDGFRFPKDLLLFRKAWFTLRGVLLQLDPVFDPGPELVSTIGRRIFWDLPRRMMRGSPLGWLTRTSDPLLSDTDLLRLAFHAEYRIY
ncbi:MAG TPA: AarF/UbiB family protein [Candidatus Ozemobacteraceae bacterium]|nr:AarF/UbiB family protein [Candidatus Ozemobacteraceae bacterium]HQG27595.1 AarF/UbiB family protein [Candidatus Ozemobacteraceae bacterium]